jgi:glycosyltransferase involved in cell wall biosynthesis
LISPQPFFAARGSPIRVRAEAQALAELGFEVDLLAFPFGTDIEIPGVTLIRTPNPFGLQSVPIGPSFWKGVYDLFLFWKAWELVLREPYLAIHCVEEAGLIGLLLKPMIRCKLVYDKHSDVASYRGGRLRNCVVWLYQVIERQVIRRADVVVTGQPLVALTRSLAGHSRVYPVCDVPSTGRQADPEQAQAIRRRLQRRADDLLVMYLGNFAAYQGLELMFQSIDLVAGKCREARFVIIGGLPDEVAKWRKWLAGKKSAESVLFLAPIDPDDVPAYLAAADILLSPRAKGRGAPLKHLDYLNAHRAIVGPDTPANRFYLNRTVALLTGATARDFADGITQLIEKPALRLQLVHNGGRSIGAAYDYRQLREGLELCYAALGLAGNAGREGVSPAAG